LIEADVSEKFMIALSGQKLSSKAERNFSGLNFPKKYAPCTGKDGANSELFIVEGDSAGTGVRRWRDPETMGIYSIRGKPYNALRVNVNLEDAARDIAQNDIYQDIMRLVGIHPGMTDMSGLKYQRIVILTDADPDGHHIASLLISNLYAVCPAFVEDGRLLWVEPPYYAVTHTSSRSAKKIYMRTAMDLIAWMSEVVYEPAIGISVDYGHPNDTGEIVPAPQALSGMDYTAFVAIVRRIGQTIDNLSGELSISPEVLYMLTFVSHLLNSDDVDVLAVNDILGIDNVVYSKERQTITLAIGEQDHYVPLYRTMSRIYDELMPLLRDIRWRTLTVQVTYRNIADAEASPMPLYQLYLLLQSFDPLFRIEPLKGLGSMDPKDCAEICLNPINRQEHVIRGLGSDLSVFDLLGRTSSARKQVLSDASQ
jgi:DNA gyrase/topoisomerase IV subunit B